MEDILYLVFFCCGVLNGCFIMKFRYDRLLKSLRESKDISNYELDQGWFSHKERGGKFCPTCLAKESMEIPLLIDAYGWSCPVCKRENIKYSIRTCEISEV